MIGSYVALDRKGGNHWACCPFHHEKTPSFAVNEGQSFILEIPLDELGNSKPETIYLRLEALVNGKLSYVLINFEIEW